MVVNKVLILGSTLLTELVVNKLKDKYELVGYVPSVNPTREGKIDLPIVDMDTDCDIKLSVQYDKIIKDTDKLVKEAQLVDETWDAVVNKEYIDHKFENNNLPENTPFIYKLLKFLRIY